MINFRRIELHGFKSFADKVIINFNDGVTGIVGPNGCGKSNISDAVRWVLGESSAKNVRGVTMSDVIFIGSAKRHPMNIAEVSLVFDNENAMFPSKSEREITITRKIYKNKNKGSEYFLNGISCTRQEIVNMLYDTGVGKEGYSIIEQGKVAKILSSKPEERRNIFEDAAGVRALHIDKEKSEKSLAETDSNILRCKDILMSTSEMLEPLRKMSEQAKTYLEVHEELKKLEINSYLYQKENSATVNKELYEKLQGLQNEQQSIQRSIDTCTNEIIASNAKLAELDTLKLKLINDKNTMQINLEGKKGNKNLLKEKLSNINKNMDKAAAAIEEAKYEIGEKNKAINQNSEKLQDYARKLTSINDLISVYEKAKEEQQIEVDAAKKVVYSGHDERGKLMEDITKISSSLSGLNSEKNALTEKQLELSVNIKKAETDLASFEKDNELTRKAIVEKTSELEKLNKNCGACKKAAMDAQSRKIELNGKIIEGSKYISTIEGQLKVYNEDNSMSTPLKRLQRDKQRNPDLAAKMLGSVAEIIKVNEKYELAIETLLGAATQFLVVEDEADAKYILQYLSQNRYGRMTLLPLSSMKPRSLDFSARGVLREVGVLGIASELVDYDARYSNIISSQLGNTIIVDNYDHATAIAKKYGYNVRMGTLEGDIFATSGAISGGSKRGESGILSQEKKISDFTKALVQLKKEYAENREDLSILDSEIKENEENVEKLISKINPKSLEINDDKNKLLRLNDDIIRAKNLLVVMTNELDMVLAKLANVQKKLSENETTNQMLKTNSNLTDMQFSDTRKKLEDGTCRLSELDNKILNYKIELKDASNMFSSLTDANDTMSNDIIFKERTIEFNRAQQMQLQEDSISIHEELQKVTFGIDSEVDEEILQMDAKIKAVDLEKQALSGDLEVLAQKKERLILDQMNKITIKIAKEEARVEETLSRFNEMEQRINEEYNLTDMEMQTLIIADFDFAATQPLVEKLKKKKAGYGNIDTNVIDEYAAAKLEHDTRSEQLLDCYATKAKLESLIASLTKQILCKFKTEFEKISENFKQVFTDLFGGGKGELRLAENPDSPLDFDIEIFAVPKGKALQSMSLLSGGEQALTAIAILFAILKMKSLPFCILDEIDAALDDTNAGLYASYLKKFSESTQFIVITHKKPTMEYCDELYGVTMEENGVTKMFNVLLTQAVKLVDSK